MKYCRFLLDGQAHYGTVEERSGELWISGPAPAPEEDLAFSWRGAGCRRELRILSRCL